MRDRVGILLGDNPALLAGTLNVVDISTGASGTIIHYTARADCQLDALGIAVVSTITGGASGAYKFGRIRAGSHDDDYFIAAATLAENTAQGQEFWTDSKRMNTGETLLSWATTANAFDERKLNRGDVITFTIAAGNTGKVLPLVRLQKR